MGKFWDFLLADSWEEYQRIQLYKKLGKKLEETSIKPIQDETAIKNFEVQEWDRSVPSIDELNTERKRKIKKVISKHF